MSRLRLLKSGLWHLLRGDVRTPLNWLCRQVLSDSEPDDLPIVDRDSAVPAHLTSHDSASVVQDDDRYFSVLDGPALDDIELSTDDPFDLLEFGIGNSSRLDSISIDVQFPDGNRTVLLRNGLYDEDLNHVPVALQTDQHTEATLSVRDWKVTDSENGASGERESDDDAYVTEPFLTLPSVGTRSEPTRPIFLISVDTWRYDYVDGFQPLLDFLGSAATVPEEPRTQGFFTTPSHASMFTGVHPGDHGHVMANQENNAPIPGSLVTLGEFLADSRYKNAGLVSHTRLLPNYGYGRGFHRYELDNKRPSNWMRQEGNARSLVDTTRRWVDEDVRAGRDRPFYFLHLFDPHPPFYPPLPNVDRSTIDFAAIERFLDDATMTADDEDYIQLLEARPDIDADVLSEVQTTYREAVEYTGDQLLALMRHLDRHELLDESLLVITGDHGYEFGERGFVGAKSLYDGNIRQGMIVKPPASSSWTVPERCDTIDILPTIAHEIGAEPPSQCQGTPWQEKSDDPQQPRIVERIRMKHYNVAVELDGTKAIYTFDSDYPNRPTAEQLAAGPLREEYYHLDAVRGGDFAGCGECLSTAHKERFREVATQFTSRRVVTEPTDEFVQPSQETQEQLRNLGYK